MSVSYAYSNPKSCSFCTWVECGNMRGLHAGIFLRGASRIPVRVRCLVESWGRPQCHGDNEHIVAERAKPCSLF